MNNGMSIKCLNVHTTTQCTLRCKKCGWSFPYFERPVNSDAGLIVRSLEKVFQVYDYIDDFRLAGAESFLHPDIERIILASAKYKEQFGHMCIVTNGTYLPRQSIFNTLQNLSCKVFVRVDHYGILSRKYDEVISTLKRFGIPLDERNYNETEQYFDGWVDLGGYEYRSYSEEQLNGVFRRCRMPDDCSVLWDGKLYNCQYCVSGLKLDKIQMAQREIVDLFDETTIQQKKETIKAWRDTPFIGCAYCYGFDPKTSPRIPAAEQMV